MTEIAILFGKVFAYVFGVGLALVVVALIFVIVMRLALPKEGETQPTRKNPVVFKDDQ